MVFVTSLGIVGLTGFWVQPWSVRSVFAGRLVRRVGRWAVVRYFLVENAMLCGAGVVFVAVAAWGLNLWFGVRYGVPAIPPWIIGVCSVAILAIGQASASLPSTRAARMDPAKAIRAT